MNSPPIKSLGNAITTTYS